MIRFACPGCNSTFTVGDEKAGKTGKCPKCQSQFMIPDAPETAAAPPPPNEPVSDDIEIAPCPGCQARLSVAKTDLGTDVECPYCQTVYKAKRPGAAAPPPPAEKPKPKGTISDALASMSAPKRRPADEDDDRPSRRRRDEDDEEDRPRRRPVRDEEEDEDRPSRDEDDEEEKERPRRKKKKRRPAPASSSAATTGLVLGIISLFVWCIPCLGWIIGGLAIKYGNRAKEETDGEVGNGAVIMGTISVILSFLMFFANIVIRIMNK